MSGRHILAHRTSGELRTVTDTQRAELLTTGDWFSVCSEPDELTHYQTPRQRFGKGRPSNAERRYRMNRRNQERREAANLTEQARRAERRAQDALREALNPEAHDDEQPDTADDYAAVLDDIGRLALRHPVGLSSCADSRADWYSTSRTNDERPH